MEVGSSPPALGVKVNVASTPARPATRSPAAMLKVTAVTAPPILPDITFAVVHRLGCNSELTPTEPPAVGRPIVKPPMVTVTTADALIEAPEVVKTTAVAEVSPYVAVKPTMLLAPEATVGTTKDAKKLTGYESVNVLPVDRKNEGEKTRVRGTDCLPDTRSEKASPKLDGDTLKQ